MKEKMMPDGIDAILPPFTTLPVSCSVRVAVTLPFRPVSNGSPIANAVNGKETVSRGPISMDTIFLVHYSLNIPSPQSFFSLAFLNCKIRHLMRFHNVNKFGGEAVTYEGVGGTKKWERIESYGSNFVENIVQAISRDILSFAMQTLSHRFICGHVHDELINEYSKDFSLDAICEQMGRTPSWAKWTGHVSGWV